MKEDNDLIQKGNDKQNAPTQSAATAKAAMTPAVDVIEDSGGITLFADLPGVAKDRLHLHLDSDSLTIEGELGFDMPHDMQSSHAEVSVPRYRRVFTLSRDLDGDKTTAEFNQGVLTLRIPKTEHAQPRKIAVNAA